jgi:hypothetical protein
VRSSRLGRVEAIAKACVLGERLGNLLDRCVYDSRAFDFLSIGIGYLRTGVFNVADDDIMLGVALLLLSSMRRGPTLPGSAGQRICGPDTVPMAGLGSIEGPLRFQSVWKLHFCR